MAKARRNSTARPRKPRPGVTGRGTGAAGRRLRWLLLAALLGLAFAGWSYRKEATGYARAAAAYSARVACSCRHVAGRPLDDCARDRLEGMELVSLKEDAQARSVTARFPLLASETARFREGYGCVLHPWRD